MIAVSDPLITVCAVCRCASCWQGIFYCEEYKTANVIEVPKSELLKEQNEHPSYLDIE